MPLLHPRRSLALAFGLIAAIPCLRADPASLYRDFVAPPDQAKIMMRWWWFGPAVTKPELEREMRMMKAGGIGGFEVQPVYPLALDGRPPGLRNLRFLSPEFLDMLKFTAAKARELGLRMDLTLGSGWPYGGPMFSLAEGAGELRAQTAAVPAGRTSAAVPPLGEAESLVAAFVGPTPGAQAAADTYRDFYRRIEVRDGAAWLPEGMKGPAPVLFFVASHTGMQVKRAAVGAEGYVLDHYSRAAVDKFLREVAGPELAACGPNVPYSTFCDSLEVYNTDWTGDLLAEFRRRRGYDLTPYLPALAADNGPQTAAIRHDWGQTLTEVFDERFVAPIQAWSAARGTQFRIQAYGTPPANLASYAAAALPEGEGDGWRGFRPTRWASSASHLLGRNVTSTETWTWLHSPVFRATPLDMKASADTYFLQGSNQLIGHGWPYTAENIPDPGWRFYASAVFDEKNPWWIAMPDVARYLQRVSFVLRQGEPANDVALYAGDDDAWSRFTTGHVAMSTTVSRDLGPNVIPAILDAGYNFDLFDDGLLRLRGRAEGGALAFGALRYRAVVLPGIEQIPLDTLRTLEKFARGGGTLVATRRLPDSAPGLRASEADQAEVRALVARLFTDPGAPGIFVPTEDRLGEALNRRLAPDLKFVPAPPSPLPGDAGASAQAADVGFVHRHTDDGEVYFIANTSNLPARGRVSFRFEGAASQDVQWWDPVTGQALTQVADGQAGLTATSLALPAYGSVVAVIPPRGTGPIATAGLPRRSEPIAPIDLSGDWTVSFGSAPAGAMPRLAPWTDDPATRNFSGVAAYQKDFSLPARYLDGYGPLVLTFGPSRAAGSASGARGRFQARLAAPVRETAVVYVNGRRAGSAWCPPYAVDLTPPAVPPARAQSPPDRGRQPGGQRDGRHPLPDYTELNAKYGERFEPQEMNEIQAVPAGLFGPVSLQAGRPPMETP